MYNEAGPPKLTTSVFLFIISNTRNILSEKKKKRKNVSSIVLLRRVMQINTAASRGRVVSRFFAVTPTRLDKGRI